MPNLTLKHPMVEDFRGTMLRLDRTKFKITYMYVEEKNGKRINPFVHQHPGNGFFILTKEPSDAGDGAWVRRWHPIAEGMEFNVLFNPDLMPGPARTRLTMVKLAPAQAVSHGHPRTSRIPSLVKDYNILWGMAEVNQK